jgi:gamma-glutamyl hydrolase
VKHSKLFQRAPDDVLAILTTLNVTMNNHEYGVFPDTIKTTPSLESFYSVLSTNRDRNGLEFVSTVESVNYPVYGTQWHPEKNIFE